MNKLAVVAIGGNALVPDSDHLSLESQYEKVKETAVHIADMMLEDWNVVVTHGNGPQVGMVLRRSDLSSHEIPPVSMDYAGADVQGAIGYMFCRALRNEFLKKGVKSEPVAVVTQTLVDRLDPAFSNPTKPIGSWFSEEEAKEMAKENGWKVVDDSGRGWRRVVASPKPVEIIEQKAIVHLIEAGLTVISLGGGGIPVIKNDSGELEGIDAVIDKDMSSALLAASLKANILLLPTGVEKVAVQFGKPGQKWLDKITVAEAEKYMADGEFPDGSMGPKMQALISYVQSTGGTGIITTPEKMRDAVKGVAGTHIIS